MDPGSHGIRADWPWASWALGFTDSKGVFEREKALKDPCTLPSGSRPAKAIVDAWAKAMKEALNGFEFPPRTVGSKNPTEKPNEILGNYIDDDPGNGFQPSGTGCTRATGLN